MSDHSLEHQSFQEENNRKVKIQIAISRVLEASPVKHQGDRESAVNAVIAKISQNHTIRVADRGWVVAENRSGIPVDLTKLVQDALLLDRNIGDPESIAAAVRDGSIELGAKDELSTTQQKVEFIRKYGDAAWAKLPAHRQAAMPTNLDQVTAAEYKDLPLKVRMTMSETQISAALKRR